ncbi:MAG: hypothetical protein GY771_08185, partial [bacterium]|nr:hypothetical protein [bacterium]
PVDHPDWEATVVAVEDVTVPAGTFEDCYKIEYYYESLSQGKGINTIWYASGVGGRYGVDEGFYSLSSYNLPSK